MRLAALYFSVLMIMPVAIHANQLANPKAYVQLAEDDNTYDSTTNEEDASGDVPGDRPVWSGGRGDTPYPAPYAQGLDVVPSDITPRGGGSYSEPDTCCSAAD